LHLSQGYRSRWLDETAGVILFLHLFQRIFPLNISLVNLPILKRYRRILPGLVVVCVLQAGCGGQSVSDLPPLGAVSGVVTLDAKPLPGAMITFVPLQAGRPSTAVSDDNGHYVLTYDSTHAGAVIGKHRVSISTAVAAEYDENQQLVPGTGIRESVPARYHSPSRLELEVSAGENTLNLELKK